MTFITFVSNKKMLFVCKCLLFACFYCKCLLFNSKTMLKRLTKFIVAAYVFVNYVQNVHIINRTLHSGSKICIFMFECQEQPCNILYIWHILTHCHLQG